MTSKKDLNFFRRISMVGAVLLIGITLMYYAMPTDIIDLPLPRILIALSLIILTALSYFSQFVKQHCFSLFYGLMVVYITYAIFLSYCNHFPIYDVSATMIVAIALAALIRSKRFLIAYLSIVYLDFIVLFLLCKEPVVQTNYLVISLSLLIYLAYFVLVGKLDAIASLIKSREALQKSETRFKKIFEHSPMGILLMDQQFKVLQVNPTSTSILGYSEEELKLIHPAHYIDAKDISAKKVLIDKIKGSGNKPLVIEQEFRHKNGKRGWLRTNVDIMDELQDDVPCLIAMIEDISFEQTARLKLKDYAEKLKNHNESLEEFSYVVSHDLQEPLRMIKSYSTLIQRKYINQLKDKEANIDIRYVMDGADRMSLLLRDMLNYSKWSAKPFTSESVNSFEVLTEVIQNLGMSIQEKQAEIICYDMPNLKTNRVLLGQIFQNLLGNGIKYSQPNRDPRVSVFGEERESDILFTIKDNGKGFSNKDKQRIFGLFQRLDPHGKNKGTGIGLAICKRIIERQGGQIWAEARPGQGSTFYFTLPKNNLVAIEL